MSERRYNSISDLSWPPRPSAPSSRDVYPSRHHNAFPRHGRETGEYPREADRTLRIEKKYSFDRDFDRPRRIEKEKFDRDFCSRGGRLRNYDDRDRDRFGLGSRRSTSPRRIEKRDYSDRDANMPNVRLSDYDGGKHRARDVVGGGSTRRLYNEDLHYAGSASTKFQQDHLLDTPKKPDTGSVKDYNYTSDYYVSGDYTATGSGGERDSRDNYTSDYHVAGDYTARSGGERDSRARYSDRHQDSLLPMSSSKPVSLEYEKGEKMQSDPYAWANNVGVGGISDSNLAGLEGRSHFSSVASQYLDNDAGKRGYSNFRDEPHLSKRDESFLDHQKPYFEKEGLRDELHLAKRDGAFLDPERPYFEKKGHDFHSQDLHKLDKLERVRPVGREIYKHEKQDIVRSSRDNSKGSEYFPSLSQSKGYVSLSSGTFEGSGPSYLGGGDSHMPSHSQSKCGFASESTQFNELSEKRQTMSPRVLGHQSDYLPNSARSYLQLPEVRRRDHLYDEFGRGEIDSPIARPRRAEERYGDHHDSVVGDFDSIVDKSYKRKRTSYDELRDPYPSSLEKSTPDKISTSISLHESKKDLDMLGSGSLDLNHGREVYPGHGYMKERNAEVGSGPWSLGERSDVRSRDYESSIGKLYDSPKMGLVSEDLSRGEPSGRRLRHEHVRGKALFDYGAGLKISSDGNGARRIYNQVDDEMDFVSFTKKPKLRKYGYDKGRRVTNEMANYQQSSGKSIPSHSSNPHKSDCRDIKRRLGPLTPKLHVSQRLEKPSIKNRLGPVPSKKHTVLPWTKSSSSNMMPRTQDDSDGNGLDQDVDHLADHLRQPEPPEKSEEFKQLVQSAFFKFFKQINETPMERKKYMERGNAGNLKCTVCCSNSDEFVDTDSLVMHAFTSGKVGLRSQHLGLHKALCVLNGWKTAEVPNSIWHCEEIPNAEKAVLKEDIIIWPPVMIIQNSTIDNKNPDELLMKLRGGGFGNILKVCNGKSANQSVMVVKFNGTLSGLQEAERLHKRYFETKHGRTELQPSESSKKGRSSEGTPAADKESILCGHLGLAEDLDKLDCDTKKRCVLRSKREILSIVDAPLDTKRENGSSF